MILWKCCTQYVSKFGKTQLRVRLQQYMNWELLAVQAGCWRGRRTRDQIANICWIMMKARSTRKKIYFCFINYTKAFDCVNHKNLWKILKETGILGHLLVSWETCMWVKSNRTDMKQLTGSNLGKKWVKAVYFHLA